MDWVMMGHIAVPALDPSDTPATLSLPIARACCAESSASRGLLVTDGMDMAGVRPAWTGEAAVRAVQAGADLVLLPPGARGRRAVAGARRCGKDSSREARIDASGARILETKERLGLDREPARGRRGHAQERATARGRGARARDRAASITVVRNEGGVLPLRAEEPLRLLHLVLSSDVRNPLLLGIPEDELEGPPRFPRRP